MSELGTPSVVTLAANSGQRIIAASSPRPAGRNVRAVRIPVAACKPRIKTLLATDCTTANAPPPRRGDSAGGSAIESASAELIQPSGVTLTGSEQPGAPD